MTSAAHNESARIRDEEVARLHPGVERRHLRTTLPARVVLRAVERETHEREIKLVGESYVTAVIDNGVIEFYAGSDPVWHAASIPVTRVVGLETGSEFDYTPPRVNPTLRLKISEEGTEPLDIDLEVFSFDGTELHQLDDITDDLAWWGRATAPQ